MQLFFLLLFNFWAYEAHSASCCVANTSVPNLMILPASWQQTLTLGTSRVIGDVNDKGQSTFRNSKNKDTTQLARMDLAYSWTDQYQSGVSVRYQNKNRNLNGSEASSSGWSDVGLFQAYQPVKFHRTWIFNSINIPTSTSTYDSQEKFSVNAHGSGTYQSSLGVFHVINYKEWDIVFSSDVHYSFARSFYTEGNETRVGSFWGASASVGGGYIPWRSRLRYGINLTPRYEGIKKVTRSAAEESSKQSVVWDSVFNLTYTIDSQYAVGINYLDQTLFGPASNTLLNRSITLLVQTHWL